MFSVDGQCSISDEFPAKMNSQPSAIFNCQIDNNEIFFYLQVAWATLRTATECIYAHRLSLILSVMLVLFVYGIYKSYWSPVLYIKVSFF